MDLNEFGPNKSGEVIAISAPGLTHAFVPDGLPADWIWPERLWPLLLEAHKALATLDGTGKHLPNPELVLRPIQNREALKSSSLEGTYTDPQQQMLFELDPTMPTSVQDPANAQREVFNYAQALRLRRTTQENLPLSLRLIRHLHDVLMTGVRGGDKNPGQFRRTQNQIGRPARYVPPPVQHLDRLLDSFEKYLHGPKRFDPLVEAFLVHYQFEAIHPFTDGNGRVGRLLLAITIAEWCGLSNQWLYMSPYFDRNKDKYIDLLFDVSARGTWDEWVEFCLRGVVEECQDTLRRCERLIALNRVYHNKVNESGGSVRLSAVVDDLFIRPVTAVSRVAKKLQVTYPTARSDLAKLEQLGIVRQLSGAKQISYFCDDIFAIVYTD